MSTPAPQALIDRTVEFIAALGPSLVAFSGGVDSALVAAIARRALGDRMLACIGISPSYPKREQHAAERLASDLGLPVRLVDTAEHLDPAYRANDGQRCYFCKNELYGHLQRIAEAEGWHAVLDGTNADDLGEHRPGRQAAAERRVRSPLAELGITKQQVRQMAKAMGLGVWDKPAMACLASRVPHGTPVTPQLLAQIEQAEDVLVELGFAQFRVRHHDSIARIELPVEDLPRAVECRKAIIEGIRAAGYRFICLDLAGFRSGSLSADGTAAAEALRGHSTPIALTIGRHDDRLP